MKNVVITVIVHLLSAITFAQKQPPNKVQLAFTKQYPNIKMVKWESEMGNFEAGFKQNKINYSVLMNAKGNIIETENEISVRSLSKPIIDYILKNYPNQKIKGAAKITNAVGVVTYESELQDFDLIFDSAGNFIKTIKD